MNELDLIRHMASTSGMSLRAISVAMGKHPTYLSATLRRDGGVGASTLAKIAKVCGYELRVEGHGETVAVDGRGDS
ncbi:MAG: helix-turn-helix transcriptional regulator [Atopobiaceae bacterium]|nr:helix-turn-helix transcriptional regulator [Atopobiaceae bacterium]